MTIRVTVILHCDAKQAPNCHREYSAHGDNVAVALFAAKDEAQRLGWRVDWTTDGERDLCPACVHALAARSLAAQ